MAKKITISFTPTQLVALTDLLDTISAISDGFDDDGTTKKQIKKIDSLLLKHGYKRKYN